VSSVREESVAVAAAEHVAESVEEANVEQAAARNEEGPAADVAVKDGVSGQNDSMIAESLSADAVVDKQVEETNDIVSDGGCRLYLKAMPLRDTLDLEGIKAEVEEGNILILRITPLASKSIEAVKNAVNELYMFAESIGGDIARLGEERVVICPKNVRIWREKTSPKQSEAS